jgi:hypothetical protein
MCDLDLGPRDLNFACDTLPHNSELSANLYWNPLVHVEVLLRTSVFSMTSRCDLYLWPRGLVHASDMASHKWWKFLLSLMKFLHGCRRYAPDRNWTPSAQSNHLPTRGETIIQPVFAKRRLKRNNFFKKYSITILKW